MSHNGVVFQQPGAAYPYPHAANPENPPQFGMVIQQPVVTSDIYGGKSSGRHAGTPLETLDSLHQLHIRQVRTVLELFTGCEAKNKYLINDATGYVSSGCDMKY